MKMSANNFQLRNINWIFINCFEKRYYYGMVPEKKFNSLTNNVEQTATNIRTLITS